MDMHEVHIRIYVQSETNLCWETLSEATVQWSRSQMMRGKEEKVKGWHMEGIKGHSTEGMSEEKWRRESEKQKEQLVETNQFFWQAQRFLA